MLTVRPGTGLDEDVAVSLWQDDLARRGERSGGPPTQSLRQRLRSPQALLLVADEGGRAQGVLLLELARADAQGEPVGDGDGPVLPGLVHLGVLAARPGTATRALLRAATGRFDRLSAWTREPGPFQLAGFTPTGRARGDEVQLLREPLTPYARG